MKLIALTKESFSPFGEVVEASLQGDQANQGY